MSEKAESIANDGELGMVFARTIASPVIEHT
jgi:hypothetical protein